MMNLSKDLLKSELVKLAEEITSVRNFLWQVTEDMPMTRNQMHDIEIIKNRLWDVQETLRKDEYESA